jgi:hypothetical protein
MRLPNHACRFEGISKTNLQGSGPSDPETVQYQIGQPAEKRLPLSHLEIVHGRLGKFEDDFARLTPTETANGNAGSVEPKAEPEGQTALEDD